MIELASIELPSDVLDTEAFNQLDSSRDAYSNYGHTGFHVNHLSTHQAEPPQQGEHARESKFAVWARSKALKPLVLQGLQIWVAPCPSKEVREELLNHQVHILDLSSESRASHPYLHSIGLSNAKLASWKEKADTKWWTEVLQVLRPDTTGAPKVVVVHCSGGVHRTGGVVYAFLRVAGRLSDEDSMRLLRNMRHVIADDIGNQNWRFRAATHSLERCRVHASTTSSKQAGMRNDDDFSYDIRAAAAVVLAEETSKESTAREAIALSLGRSKWRPRAATVLLRGGAQSGAYGVTWCSSTSTQSIEAEAVAFEPEGRREGSALPQGLKSLLVPSFVKLVKPCYLIHSLDALSCFLRLFLAYLFSFLLSLYSRSVRSLSSERSSTKPKRPS